MSETLEKRTFLFEFDRTRLVVTNTINLGGGGILLHTYHPKNLNEPYVYFDTSRGKFDAFSSFNNQQERDYWPIYPGTNGVVRAFVKVDLVANKVEFMNPKSFQVLAAGTDDEWSLIPGETGWDDAWDTYSDFANAYANNDANNGNPERVGMPHSFPDGPFLGPLADNLVNFSPRNLENSQP